MIEPYSDTIRAVVGLTPYIHLHGAAREALSFYAAVFGGTARLHTFSEFGRTDGAPDSVAHGSSSTPRSPCTLRTSAAGSRRSALKA